MEELQSILEAVDAAIDSSDFSTMTDEQLTEAAAKISEYGKSIRSDKPSEQEVADAIALASALKAVTAEIEVRDLAAASRKSQADEAFAAFGGEPEPTPEPDPTEPPPVTASRPSAAEVARRRPMSAEPKQDAKPVALIATAGEKPDSLGTRFADGNEVADAMYSAWNQLADGSRTVARIPIENRFKMGEDAGQNYNTLAAVMAGAQEARNNDIGLTAALGCAPSEPLYDFFNQSARGAGLVDLPSVTARRGSRTYPPIVAYPTISGQTGVGTQWAGASKTCYTVNCGTTRTTDVIANYNCLTFDNEEGFFYPEQVAHYQSLALIAFEHAVNQRLIEGMRDSAITTTVHDLDTLGGTVVGLIRALARVRAYYIERHKMAETSIVDAILPYWFAAAYASDIAARQSTDFASRVDLGLARISDDLRQVGVNAQFVYDWQQGPAEGYDDFGSAIVFAPGTFVRMDGPTLDLGVVRDSTLNAANDFQVWMEGWTGLAAVGNQALYVQGIDICPNGATGATAALTCGAS